MTDLHPKSIRHNYFLSSEVKAAWMDLYMDSLGFCMEVKNSIGLLCFYHIYHVFFLYIYLNIVATLSKFYTGVIKYIGTTHMEPVGARQVFPCMDEPDSKPFQISHPSINKSSILSWLNALSIA